MEHARLAAVRSIMNAEGIDLVAVHPGSNMEWIMGFHPDPCERACLLLVGSEREAMLMPALNEHGTRARTNLKMFVWADEDGPKSALSAALEYVAPNGASSAVFDEAMRLDHGFELLDLLRPDVERRYAASTIGQLRCNKNEEEYEKLKLNAAIADRAMLAGLAAVEAGVTEADVARAVSDSFASEQTHVEFCIVASGPNGAFPHHEPGSRRLQTGDAVIIDLGGKKLGYQSDLTRMAFVGEPSEEYSRVHAVVEAAVVAALDVAKPGVRAKEIDAAARKVISDAGFGAYFITRTGHGIGVDGHEPPYISASSETVIQEGMVFSIEPGIYMPDRLGVRLEEIIRITKSGNEILSGLTRQVSLR